MMTGLALEERVDGRFRWTVDPRFSDGEWLRIWVGGCWRFGALMTGLALEKRVDGRFDWTVDPRFSSSVTGRTLIFSLDGLVWLLLA